MLSYFDEPISANYLEYEILGVYRFNTIQTSSIQSCLVYHPLKVHLLKKCCRTLLINFMACLFWIAVPNIKRGSYYCLYFESSVYLASTLYLLSPKILFPLLCLHLCKDKKGWPFSCSDERVELKRCLDWTLPLGCMVCVRGWARKGLKIKWNKKISSSI